MYAPPKADRERDVPLPDSVGLLLSAHLRARPAHEIALPWVEPGGKLTRVALIFTSQRGRAALREHVGRPGVHAPRADVR